MASRLFQSVVGTGIALGVAQAGCLGDTRDSADEASSLDAASLDSIVLAFCDTPWPTTKGASVTQAPSCDDPLGECASIPVTQWACQSPPTSATWACSAGVIFPACVGGKWACPTSTWTCSMGVMQLPRGGD